MSNLSTNEVRMRAAAEIEMLMARHAQMLGSGGFAQIWAMAIGYGIGNAAGTLGDAKEAVDVVSGSIRQTAIEVFLEKGRAK